jgi:hypothetical protein
LIGLGFILLIAGIWYYLHQRKNKKPFIPKKTRPIIPAHIQALNDLDDLKKKKLWQAGRIKDYYTELTDISRLYIEHRFGINAMEMTSFEIMEVLPEEKINPEELEKLSQTLSTADMVKFAKASPLPGTNDNCWLYTKEFVEKTIIRPKPETNGESKIAPNAQLTAEKEND